MAGIFRWLFGGSSARDTQNAPTVRDEHRRKTAAEPEPEIVRAANPSLPGPLYFAQLERLTSSVSARHYSAAAVAARASLPLLRNWLNDPRGDGQQLDIRIPALSQGGTMLAIVGDRAGLCELCKLVHDFNHLKAYREEAEEHFVDLDLFDRLRKVIRSKPGVLQDRIKAELGIGDGRRASRLISYLEKSGEVRRAKSGKTYELYIAGVDMPEAAVATIYKEPARPGSHRPGRNTARPHELDPKRVNIVPLPPSPNAWERSSELPVTEEAFADPDGAWSEIVIEPIAKSDRPDPAFRRHYSTRGGAFSFDDLAKSEESLGAAGAVMFSDVQGRSGTPAPLRRDAYNISVHPQGDGFALRSKSGVLTVYRGDLSIDFEADLEAAPEVAANRERLGLAESEAHRALRCIALTPDRDRYLFTHVDEAWCISRDGECLWGLRMPAKEPTRIKVGGKVDGASFGTAIEIDQALDVMGLAMPVTPDEIRKRYRQLVRELHPDVNPGNEERMKAVNVASEQLTGLDPEQLDGSGGGDDGFEIVISFGPAAEADWIYAAAFSGTGQTALLGTYAGRVVRVDRNGTPITIYDVGSMPIRIVETEAFLYVMTTTRLYVLDGNRLMAIEDCSPKCDLLVIEGMVLLVEGKGIRVFTEDGRRLGIALTKAPIRRAYVDAGDVVVETRTQRGSFRGIHAAPKRRSDPVQPSPR
ncbi:DnaJ domain-containing protein [Paenirhodobacter sp.]|uniref:DnaJ domain-containing protein n=1 Tax=Paenirhodobacter sp. TaxID=1965326 RepID=UPI003B3C3B07